MLKFHGACGDVSASAEAACGGRRPCEDHRCHRCTPQSAHGERLPIAQDRRLISQLLPPLVESLSQPPVFWSEVECFVPALTSILLLHGQRWCPSARTPCSAHGLCRSSKPRGVPRYDYGAQLASILRRLTDEMIVLSVHRSNCCPHSALPTRY